MTGPHALAVEYEPRLVEEATLLALRGSGEETAFRQERDRLYEVAEPEAREAAFRAFHAAWFERLGLSRAIGWALRERGVIIRATRACVVTYAASSRQEGAELFVRPPEDGISEAHRRSVVIRLRPERLLASASLLEFLRHELLHIADMLDPRFAYEPWLPSSDAGPAHRQLLTERYRVLWDAYVDGRLARLGWAAEGIREQRLAEFRSVFPMLRDRTPEAFQKLFDASALRHEALVAFALAPSRVLEGASRRVCSGARCPLCGFPTYAFEPDPAGLPPAVLEAIRSDFPEWDPAAGLCLQCADLYRARSLSSTGLRPAG